MTGYKLSSQAAAAEQRRQAQRSAMPVKSTWTLESGRASLSDRDNFTTNRVTLAEFNDSLALTNPLGLSATYACVNLLAGTTASLSATVWDIGADGVKVEARNHPLFWILKLDPNFDQSDFEFWEYTAAAIELQGNAYAKIERNGGRIAALLPKSPVGMQVRRGTLGGLEYVWHEDGRRFEAAQDEMLHIRGFGGNGIKGAATLTACAGAFGAALATDSSASKFFSNGVRPSGTLSTDSRLDGTQRAELEQLLQEKFAGSMNSGRPMLLDGGLKWNALSIDPESAQLLESRKFSGEEICRIFGVPPAMVGYGDKSSNWGTGKEVDVLGFLKFALRKRLRRIERALMKQLLTREERHRGMSIEFNLEGILRGSSQERADFYDKMVRLGLMTRNEVRRLENLPPIEGGDVVTVQMQDVPLAQATSGNANSGD